MTAARSVPGARGKSILTAAERSLSGSRWCRNAYSTGFHIPSYTIRRAEWM